MSSTSSSRESWLGLWRFARIFALVERLWSKRGTFTYVGLMGCAAFLGILRLFALGKLLPKDEFGTYSFIVLAIQYIAPLASLGVVEGVAQWLPQALGRNDRGEALQIRAHGFSMLCMLTGCLSAIWISGVGISQYLGFESGNLAVAGFGSCMLFLIYSFVLRDIRSQLKRGWFSG